MLPTVVFRLCISKYESVLHLRKHEFSSIVDKSKEKRVWDFFVCLLNKLFVSFDIF